MKRLFPIVTTLPSMFFSKLTPIFRTNYFFMKKILLLSVALLSIAGVWAQALSYYLPTGINYNPAIPTPKSIIGHEVGEFHVSHDRLVNYMKAIAAANPDRITIEETGRTWESRPQLLLTITSPANQKRIEEIRAQHLQLSNPQASATLNTTDMPVVVWMGFSIHGNEPSGANASLLTAYYLAAAQGPQIEDMLAHTVILLDPSFNPDGLNRFASWVNTNKSLNTTVTDPATRELNEMWPGGRTNHYLFDLNRDWLPAQQPESQNRLKKYQMWLPNILTDHHEQGSNATFFFQPGVPSRVNPNTPKRNQELTGQIAAYHAKYLDSIGSLYFTKEGYDDFYYGKGSTYPDVNGAIGILFEQASSRGHAQETDNGILTFPFTIRNQFTTTLSTLEAAQNLRKPLLDYQREFYSNAQKEAAASPIKGYVFGDAFDKSRTAIFVEMLKRHRINSYPLKQAITADGKNFEPGSSYIIPTAQPQYKLIKAVFEKTLQYQDSLFYDISSWTLPLAFNLPYAELATLNPSSYGENLDKIALPQGSVVGNMSSYAYAFEWDDYFAPKLLYALQAKGLQAKVATQLFEAGITGGSKKFNYGTILIPVKNQTQSATDVYKWINDAVKQTGVTVYALQSGLSSSGVDLGSNSFSLLRQPKVVLLSGAGTSSNDVGELWHVMDQRYHIPVSMVEVDRIGGTNFGRYNVMLMAPGTYTNLDKGDQEKIKGWVSAGGTLIATEEGAQVLSATGMSRVIFRKDDTKRDSTLALPYYLRSDEQRAREMPGSIFEAKLDLTHPLCYGYRSISLPVFQSTALYMDQNNGAYDSPVMLTGNPLMSGYLHWSQKDLAKNAAVINIESVGSGKIISISDNLVFRAFWLGTNKLLMNGVFFGNIIRL